jgi:hypothetical protein
VEFVIPGTRREVDLYAPGHIAECKRFADSRALRQADQYVELLERAGVDPRSGSWFVQIISAEGHSQQLAREVARRRNTDRPVQLLLCIRMPGDQIAFEDIPDETWSVEELELSLAEEVGAVAAHLEVLQGYAADLARATGADPGETAPLPPPASDEEDGWYEALSAADKSLADLDLAAGVGESILEHLAQAAIAAGETADELERNAVVVTPPSGAFNADEFLESTAADLDDLIHAVRRLGLLAGLSEDDLENAAYGSAPEVPEGEDPDSFYEDLTGRDKMLMAVSESELALGMTVELAERLALHFGVPEARVEAILSFSGGEGADDE